VTTTITIGFQPLGVAVSPDGSTVYVTNNIATGIVSVIDAATNTVTTTIAVGSSPYGVAVSPDGSTVYVANTGSGTVSVIATATDNVIATIPVGSSPIGVAVTPDGSKVYVANNGDNDVSVIGTATKAVIGHPILVGNNPVSFGIFIQSAPRFAGTPGKASCHGRSVAALGQQFDGLNDAATALGYPSVSELQTAITTFCKG
jgi:YVTN family beta-propeller protein